MLPVVSSQKKQAGSSSESVFIEHEGVLVLRRYCLHWRMRKFLGNLFFSLSGSLCFTRITMNIAGFVTLFRRMGNFCQTITIVESRYINV